MVEFKANIYVEGRGIYSVSVSNNCLCAFIEEKAQGQEANEEGQLNARFDLG